jgi:cytochrome P450
MDIQLLLNPYPWFSEMRRKDLVHFDGEVWNVFKYSDVKRVLLSHKTFSSQLSDYTQEKAERLREGIEDSIGLPTYYTMLTTDPPLHDELKDITMDFFSPSSIAKLEPMIREVVKELTSNMDGEFDFVREVAVPLPVMVIAELLGLPKEDRRKFKEWSDNIALTLGKESGKPISFEKLIEMVEYLERKIDERSKNGGKDLISLIVNWKIRGKRLAKIEALGYIILLLAAGNETTTNLITHSVIDFTKFNLWGKISRDSLMSSIEEVLRFSPPVRRTFRIAKEDVEIGGKIIKKGEGIKVWIASANRDEDVFSNPDSFDINRRPNPHLSFGAGIHLCLGASLARMEAKVLLEEMINRYKKVEVLEEPEPIPNEILNGFKSLKVRVFIK